VAEFRRALSNGELEAALDLYVGPFLDGFYVKSADSFERWAATERADIAHRAARALETLGEQSEARGEHRAALEWWRRLTRIEPLSARATVGLMRALDSAGEQPAALQQARGYELLVQEEVGGPPDPSVTQLVDELRDSAQLAYAYAVTGQRAEAELILRALLEPTRRGAALPYDIAMAYA
jgi:DNA-binding SARP family transcriptional activator